jgi:hypothetical protein
MTDPSNRHEHSAEALKALSDAPLEATGRAGDGFVGPDEAEPLDDGAIDSIDGTLEAAADPLAASASAGNNDIQVPSAIPAGDRRRRAREFEKRSRQAHAQQYKAVMVPLLLTMGAILVLMGLYAAVSGSPAAPNPDGSARAAEEGFGISFRRWFPFFAFPLGAILLTGAWWFHKDVNRKKPPAQDAGAKAADDQQNSR